MLKDGVRLRDAPLTVRKPRRTSTKHPVAPRMAHTPTLRPQRSKPAPYSVDLQPDPTPSGSIQPAPTRPAVWPASSYSLSTDRRHAAPPPRRPHVSATQNSSTPTA